MAVFFFFFLSSVCVCVCVCAYCERRDHRCADPGGLSLVILDAPGYSLSDPTNNRESTSQWREREREKKVWPYAVLCACPPYAALPAAH
ncbi:hypothetical protein LY78DRAFT_653661 [Colletotrichum sublineola]|nr:hypothetical protein LY78DRAFT_653661 [Colletotrichum sublineola]